MTNEEFETIVKETLDELPDEFKTQLDNVEIVIEDFPRDKRGRPFWGLLGLYHGVPKTARTVLPLLPDKISIYKEPILHMSDNIDEIKKQIKQTVLHELGHHFGLTDEDLSKINR
jgi:predicted Zn-dependent protease with MMP-like domain